MAVGNYPFPTMFPVKGVRLGVASAGIKKPGRKDLVLIELAPGSRVAGVFTKNAFCAAPVTLCRRHLQTGDIRFLITNSGNANACTGDAGLQDALETCRRVAELGSVNPEQVLPFSTGVIGERLPMSRLLGGIPAAFDALAESGWSAAGTGIMTTDTRPKGASVQFEHEGSLVTVSGISKGAGMIKPNMATMLGYIATDAAISQVLLDEMVKLAADQSFNRITIDGDTSTNDSCVLMATGQSGLPEIIDKASPLYEKLLASVVSVHQQLAKAIVADGEGATKFVTVDVDGGTSVEECLKVAYAVAHSPLIKTALFASDPNWGRIVAAIGYAGVDALDVTQVNIHLGDVMTVENGQRAPSYTEEAGQRVMNEENIHIQIHLGRGQVRDRVWTTDLSHDYVTINAEYRS